MSDTIQADGSVAAAAAFDSGIEDSPGPETRIQTVLAKQLASTAS